MTLGERTRRVVRAILVAGSLFSLAGAGLAGLWFGEATMDLVLIQLVFYGAWACLVGAYLGGTLGAALEEDACGELDMGAMSSMGGILGTLSAGLLGTALTGLAFSVPWQAVWLAAAAVEVVHLVVRRVWPFHLVRAAHLDMRGCVIGVPAEQQPLRMRDRVAILLAVAAATMLVLTLAMARMMGSDLGHPVMMAPMMYGMFGTMLGGMLGGWLAGLLDEHQGASEHDNPVMVGGMALMAGMMGGMPSGMIGGMMAVMGPTAVGVTVAAGVALPVLGWLVAIRGRYRLAPGVAAPVVPLGSPAVVGPVAVAVVAAPVRATVGGASLRVGGMTCAVCVDRVQRTIAGVPGVEAVSVDLAAGLVTVRWSHEFPGVERVREVVAALGYRA